MWQVQLLPPWPTLTGGPTAPQEDGGETLGHPGAGPEQGEEHCQGGQQVQNYLGRGGSDRLQLHFIGYREGKVR